LKKYSGFWEQITSFQNLLKAYHYAAKGSKNTTEIKRYFYNIEYESLRLKKELVSGLYVPSGYRTFIISDPKRRIISAAPFKDRVVHHAVCDVIESSLERIFTESSYACRKNKGTHRAVEKAREFLKKNEYYLKCDIQKFFNSVNHELLKGKLEQRYIEFPLLNLLSKIIDEPVPGCKSGYGLAIGNLTSQCFANLYLTDLDLMILHSLKPNGYLRYMDDFVLFSNSKDILSGFLLEINSFLKMNSKLSLKPEATFVSTASHGLPFLGMQIFRSVVRVNGKSLRRLDKKLKWRTEQYLRSQINEEKYERCLASMFGHLANADTLELRRVMCNNIPSE